MMMMEHAEAKDFVCAQSGRALLPEQAPDEMERDTHG